MKGEWGKVVQDSYFILILPSSMGASAHFRGHGLPVSALPRYMTFHKARMWDPWPVSGWSPPVKLQWSIKPSMTQGLKYQLLSWTEVGGITFTGSLTFWGRNYFFNFSTPVYKMWIIQEPNTLELWNKLHLKRKKRRVSTMFKILSTYICWINI